MEVIDAVTVHQSCNSHTATYFYAGDKRRPHERLLHPLGVATAQSLRLQMCISDTSMSQALHEYKFAQRCLAAVAAMIA
eukprot:5550-Heterococcus_DN1.PRE.4